MPAREFAEWQAYYELEPFGQQRDNLHSAMIASILANAYRKPSSRPYTVQDFFFVDAETARARKDAEVLAWFNTHSKAN